MLDVLNKARAVGCKIDTIEADKSLEGAPDTNCYMASISDLSHILIIPEYIKVINDEYLQFSNELFKFSGDIKVLGGSGLESVDGFFFNTRFSRIDLSEFNTCNVINMKAMFWRSNADEVIFGNMNTSNVADMSKMFANSLISKADLSRFDTYNCKDMSEMFSRARLIDLDIRNFNTSSLLLAREMFYNCHSEVIRLPKSDLSKIMDGKDSKFVGCSAKIII